MGEIVNEHFLLHPRTVVAMNAFGRLLAQDLRDADPESKPEQAVMAILAGQVLQLLDQLGEGGDAENDRGLALTALEPGETWLDLAERGLIRSTYVEHVVAHVLWRTDAPSLASRQAASPTPLWVRSLLQTIDVAGDEDRDEMALVFPEYVGLMRAARTPGNLPRLRALVGVEG